MNKPIPLRPHSDRQETSATPGDRGAARNVVDNVISVAFRARDTAIGSVARTPTEREFLPAALEIVETPVSPTLRATALTICGLVVVAIVWASLSHVDMVAVAPGKVVPLGQVKVVQPLETSVIRSIHVDDGDHVTAGAVLVELDPTDVQADLASLRYDRGQAALDAEVARLLATRDADAAFVPPASVDATLAEANHAQAVAEIRRHLAQIAGVEAERAQKRAAIDANAVTIARARDTLPLLEEKNASAKTLWSKKVGARPPVLESEQDLIEKRAELAAAEAASRQITSELAATEAKIDEIRSAFAAEASDRRTKALQKLAGFDQQIAKAGQRANWRRLVSPVDGTVQNVKIHTPGAVVTTADTLMTIVPDGTGVEIEANVENKDIGFVREGQIVEIKFDAFPFTRWGLIGGTVRKLGRDAAPASSQAGLALRPEAGTGTPSGQSGGGDLAYPAKITLSRDWIDVDGRRERIQPGMRVSAEIRTGDRRVIEYILSPVVQAVKEAGRER